MEWSTLWLILHVFAAIAAFGPTFTFGIIGAMAAKEPQHGLFAAKLSRAIELRLVLPATTLLPLFGAGLIITKRYDFWASTWLVIAAGLYTVLYLFAWTINFKVGGQLVQKAQAMTSGEGGPETMQEIMALGKKAQIYGMFMFLIFATILVLMIWRPGACFLGDPSC